MENILVSNNNSLTSEDNLLTTNIGGNYLVIDKDFLAKYIASIFLTDDIKENGEVIQNWYVRTYISMMKYIQRIAKNNIYKKQTYEEFIRQEVWEGSLNTKDKFFKDFFNALLVNYRLEYLLPYIITTIYLPNTSFKFAEIDNNFKLIIMCKQNFNAFDITPTEDFSTLELLLDMYLPNSYYQLLYTANKRIVDTNYSYDIMLLEPNKPIYKREKFTFNNNLNFEEFKYLWESKE